MERRRGRAQHRGSHPQGSCGRHDVISAYDNGLSRFSQSDGPKATPHIPARECVSTGAGCCRDAYVHMLQQIPFA
jgi:hypothetical protein